MFEAENPDDLWSVEMNVWRELLEEVYDDSGKQGTGVPWHQDQIRAERPVDLLIKLIESGSAQFSVTGIYYDLLHLRPEIHTVLIVDDYTFEESREMKVNWEYKPADWVDFGKLRVAWSDVDKILEDAGHTHNFL